MSGKYVKTPGGVFVPGEEYDFESAELFLSIVQAEYQNEIDRASALDSKLGISLPVISGYFFLIIQETDIDGLWNFTPDVGSSLSELFMSLLYPITVVTALISLCLMIFAIMTREYLRAPLISLNNAKEMSRPKEVFSAISATYYVVAIENNSKQTNKKARAYQLGLTLGIISLIHFALYMSITK